MKSGELKFAATSLSISSSNTESLAPDENARPASGPAAAIDNTSYVPAESKSSDESIHNQPPPIEPAVSTALKNMPHLLKKIQGMWKTRDLNTFISGLFLDSRDGERAGFPIEVARELFSLAQLNLQIRAKDAASSLSISQEDAIELISRGDQLALGHASSTDDIWSLNVSKRKDTTGSQNNAAVDRNLAPKSGHGSPSGIRAPTAKLYPFLKDTPPLPPSVRLDITTPTALRSARSGPEQGSMMDKGMFRCLAKELSYLEIGKIILSSLGDSSQCDWLAAAIRFTKIHCKFRKVILHVDLLTAPEQLMQQCIKEGVDHLVIYLNQASGKWRARAKEIAATDPDHFHREIRHLLQFRDKFEAHSHHRCSLSVATTSRRGTHAQGTLFSRLSEIPGLVKYREITLPEGISALDAQARGRCHCLAPFIEAHVRTNGHMVACSQDHSGYSLIADLSQTTFTDAWLSQAFRMTRQRVADGERAGRLCEICPHQIAT